MEPKILTNFAELGSDLDEFPEFFFLAKKVGLKSFADVHKTNVEWSLRKENQLKQILGRFIIFLAMASIGEYKILIGNHNDTNIYYTFTPEVSHIQLYHLAQKLYQAALRVSKK